MSQLLFDSDNIEVVQAEQYVPNVLSKFSESSDLFKNSNAYSSLKNCGRCGISSFLNNMSSRITSIQNNLDTINEFLDSSIGNYRSLESRILEKSGSFQMDSEALSSSLSSLFEISKFTREYKSEDSNAFLEFNPTFITPNSSSVVSSTGQSHVIYGNSVSKYTTSDDSGYTVSSVNSYNLGNDDTSDDYSVSVDDFIRDFNTTNSESVIKSDTTTTYVQGESTNS